MAVKWLGLDYGEKRVGVAVARLEPARPGQEGGAVPLAFPRPALLRTSRQAFFEQLLKLIAEEEPAGIVLGLPLRRDGSESLTTRQVRNFAASLKRRCQLPLYFMDEALSSAEAASLLRDGGWQGGREAGVIDSQAAVGILESFLNLAPEQRVRVGD